MKMIDRPVAHGYHVDLLRSESLLDRVHDADAKTKEGRRFLRSKLGHILAMRLEDDNRMAERPWVRIEHDQKILVLVDIVLLLEDFAGFHIPALVANALLAQRHHPSQDCFSRLLPVGGIPKHVVHVLQPEGPKEEAFRS